MFFVFTILFLINIIQIESELDSCRQTFGSNKYDLNQLNDFTISGDEGIYRYVITPCGLVPITQCGDNPFPPFEPGMTSCQVRNLGPPSFESSMGFLDGYGKPPNLEFSENTDGPGTGVIMMMRNAKCSGGERSVKVVFICDESITTPTRMDAVEFPTCQFTLRIKAAGACPIRPGPGPGPGPGPNTGGTSGGTVFIIILIVLIAVYLIGGISYNRFKENQTGLALLPHPTFWLLLVGLFINGCRFTLSYIRACGQGTSTGKYDSV